jgi:hypothetical protein
MREEVVREKNVDGLGSSHRGLGWGDEEEDEEEDEEDMMSGRSGSEIEGVGEREFSSRSKEFGDWDRGMILFIKRLLLVID